MQEVSGAIINKLTLAQYRELKANDQLQTNESYVITDLDEQLDNLIIYKESLDVNNPIILRNLPDGFYKLYGYIRYFENQSGIAGADPFVLVSIAQGSDRTYAQIIDYNGNHNYEITDTEYINRTDTSWINATLTSNFSNYGGLSSNQPQYRKCNGVVYIRGVLTPTTELTSSTSGITMFTLPSGYRPSRPIMRVCQGSGKNTWLLEVKTNGTVTLSRYGTTANTTLGTNTWLPFDESFPI